MLGAKTHAKPQVFTDTSDGLTPASGGGTTNFLRADGSFAAPGGGASEATVLGKDFFNRADSATTLGSAEVGGAWEAIAGTWGINGKRAYLASTAPNPPAGSNRLVVLNLAADGTYYITIAELDTKGRPAFRVTDHANLWAILPLTTGYELWKYESGGAASMVATSIIPKKGDQLKVILVGEVIVVQVNGETSITYSHPFNKTATKHGMADLGGTGTRRYDNFLFTDETTLPMTDPNAFPALANAADHLELPSYDGSNQGIHPDVLHIPGGWNGYTYWMAYTPFTNSTTETENPSILASNDKRSWYVPAGLTNPIDPDPGGDDFNADADLVISPDGMTLYCIYRPFVSSTGISSVVFRSSTDGISWSAETPTGVSTTSQLLSPAIVWDGTQWVMWYIFVGFVRRRTATDIAGPWSAEQTVYMPPPLANRKYWHLDVILADDELVMLMHDKHLTASNDDRLQVFTSRHGLSWAGASAHILTPAGGSEWDGAALYRSTLVKTGDNTLDVWYSGQPSSSLAWHIGFTSHNVY